MRVRKLPRSEWQVLIPDHHPGFIDWRTYEANQHRIAKNTRPGPHKAGGAVREGSALLQGLATCGHCGRRLHTHYRGRSSSPGYHCPGKILVEGRGVYCLNIGGIQIDEAVARAFIAALEPAKLAATVAAAERLEADRETSLKQWRLGVERASYEASRAERRYRAVDPDNRLVARGLEREWEERLSALEAAKAEHSRREEARPRALSQDERGRLLALGADLATVWHAATTTPRDRKELLRTLLEEVIVKVERDKAAARLTLRWKGGALAEIDLALPRSRPATIRTDEDTIALVRRLAALYPDAVIAGILNRQGRTTAFGHRFEAGCVGNLRRHWNIPCFEPSAARAEGELLTIKKAAAVLGVAPRLSIACSTPGSSRGSS
jgi:Recombinase zinc beta ribbon domain